MMTPIKRFEKLTLRAISHAFFAADALNLSITGEEQEFTKKHISRRASYTTDMQFIFKFDKVFKMILTTKGYPDSVTGFKVELSDEKHTLIPISVGIDHINIDEPLTFVHEGPWVRIIEKKIKEIYDAYAYHLKQKETIKERSEKYFKESLKNKIIPSATNVINAGELDNLLNLGTRAGLVAKRDAGHNMNSYAYKGMILEIYYTHYRSSEGHNYKITLLDGAHEFLVTNQSTDSLGNITIADPFWAKVIAYKEEQLKKEIQLVEKKSDDAIVRYFEEI